LVILTTSTKITLTVVNKGSATIAASTPIAFYNGGTTGNPIASSTFIAMRQVGIDIFPQETATLTFMISGDFNNCLLWARIMDDGTQFPATGYDDCNTANNTLPGIDCPYLTVKITTSPSDTICGLGGTIQLAVSDTSGSAFSFNYTPSFKWYRNDVLISGETSAILRASQAGTYYCWVEDGICIKRTQAVTVTVAPSCIAISNKTIDICNDTPFTVLPFNADGDIVPAGTTYIWTVSTPNFNITGATSQSIPQASISQTLTNISDTVQSITYTVTPVIGGTGTGTPFTITVMVNPTVIPSLIITVTPDD